MAESSFMMVIDGGEKMMAILLVVVAADVINCKQQSERRQLSVLNLQCHLSVARCHAPFFSPSNLILPA
jgi:hypothetical protein